MQSNIMVKINLESLLAEKGHTLYWLAKETKIPHTILHRYRHNKSDGIKLVHINLICNALDCEPRDLFVIEAEKPTRKKKK